jgi:hydrogenase/urease accessory protein HupE
VLKFALFAIASLGTPPAAVVHPGHGKPWDGFSLVHYLTEPVHLLGVVALVLVATAFLRRRARTAAMRAMQ